jgi:hypothetical protein
LLLDLNGQDKALQYFPIVKYLTEIY